MHALISTLKRLGKLCQVRYECFASMMHNPVALQHTLTTNASRCQPDFFLYLKRGLQYSAVITRSIYFLKSSEQQPIVCPWVSIVRLISELGPVSVMIELYVILVRIVAVLDSIRNYPQQNSWLLGWPRSHVTNHLTILDAAWRNQIWPDRLC